MIAQVIQISILYSDVIVIQFHPINVIILYSELGADAVMSVMEGVEAGGPDGMERLTQQVGFSGG